MTPALKSILKCSKPPRRVSFKPTCEIREFGNTDAESEADSECEKVFSALEDLDNSEQSKTIRAKSMKVHRSILLENNLKYSNGKQCAKLLPGNLIPPAMYSVNADLSHLSESTLLKHESNSMVMSRIFKHAKSLNTPLRNSAHLMMEQKKDKLTAEKQREDLNRKLKKCHGILWKRPTALREVRQNWRFSDEMESDGQNPADTELETSSNDHETRRKKVLTRRERFHRQIAIRRTLEQKKKDDFRGMYCKNNILNFIESIKNGREVRSIASKNNEVAAKGECFRSFAEMHSIFIKDTRRDTKKMGMKVKANIARRLANSQIDLKVRVAYEVILDNYDEALIPHLFYLFEHKHLKNFDDLERMFLLAE